jgi:hypothetical protein
VHSTAGPFQAYRLEHTHETVVLFGRYDAPYILRQLGEQLGTPAVADSVARHLPLVENDPAKLLPALTELLQVRATELSGGLLPTTSGGTEASDTRFFSLAAIDPSA